MKAYLVIFLAVIGGLGIGWRCGYEYAIQPKPAGIVATTIYATPSPCSIGGDSVRAVNILGNTFEGKMPNAGFNVKELDKGDHLTDITDPGTARTNLGSGGNQ